jgi:hypothetical protein
LLVVLFWLILFLSIIYESYFFGIYLVVDADFLWFLLIGNLLFCVIGCVLLRFCYSCGNDGGVNIDKLVIGLDDND